MGKSRLEAFSDGVIAIIITIMVLDLKLPMGTDIPALAGVLPVFLNYVLSFATVAIYWNNHHHLLHAAQRIRGTVLWANTHLLFWLSLFPFVTGWMGENYSAHVPAALYGIVAFMAGFSYWLLERVIIAVDGAESTLRRAVGNDRKATASVLFYALGIAGAFLSAHIAQLLYVTVALMWLVPDRRIERSFAGSLRK
jgi:uncharacterized membrane protein